MRRKKTPSELVREFAHHVVAQSEAIHRGDAKAGNKHADRYIGAWHALRDEYGDAGRDALASLFAHPDVGVRAMAAAYLLRYRTQEATRVLEAAVAEGHFESEYALERWRKGDGTWSLDPGP